MSFSHNNDFALVTASVFVNGDLYKYIVFVEFQRYYSSPTGTVAVISD